MITVILKDGAVVGYPHADTMRPGRDGVELVNYGNVVGVVNPENVAAILSGEPEITRPGEPASNNPA